MDARDKAEAVRNLAAAVRARGGVRSGLLAWSDDVPSGLRPHCIKLSRRLRLGGDIDDAVTALEIPFGEDHATLASALCLASEVGADPLALLETTARWIEHRDDRRRTGKSAAAGAVLSGRLVACLPLVFLPLTPAARAPLFDGPGLVLLGSGIALAIAGIRWIARVVPRPPTSDEPAAVVAEFVAAALTGGASLERALVAVARRPPDGVAGDLRRAVRRVRLGARWGHALALADDRGLTSLATTLQRAEREGTSMRAELTSFARLVRARRESEFEASIRRAPVMMVVPLVCCVLPSFVLLAIAPFLRGLALGS